MTYGWRKLFVSQREKLELGREKMWGRIHITPLLQAEEDRDQVRRFYADKAREKEFLGSETSIMNNDRYVELYDWFEHYYWVRSGGVSEYRADRIGLQVRPTDILLFTFDDRQINLVE